jgi:hypothetical protein
MLESLGNHSECECLNSRHGFIAVAAVAEYAGKRGYLRHPASVVFEIQLYGERHTRTVPSVLNGRQGRPWKDSP